MSSFHIFLVSWNSSFNWLVVQMLQLCRSWWGHASTSEIVTHACNRQSFALWAEDRGRKEGMACSFMGWGRDMKLPCVLILFSAGSWVTEGALVMLFAWRTSWRLLYITSVWKLEGDFPLRIWVLEDTRRGWKLQTIFSSKQEFPSATDWLNTMVKYSNPTVWSSKGWKDLINFGIASYTSATYKW